MIIGFSTGSLAHEKVRVGLRMVSGQQTAAIELSALREEELIPLVRDLDTLELSQFDYVSLHAPSRLVEFSEQEVVSTLMQVVLQKNWPIIVHPDIIVNFDLWSQLGNKLCLENMDKRKSTGRTATELESYFAKLPDATLCFDIGHARQIDPTMCEADSILRQHGNRLQQVHMSLVNSRSKHEPLNYESMLAFRRVVHLIPEKTPIILETPVSKSQIPAQMRIVEELLGRIPDDNE